MGLPTTNVADVAISNLRLNAASTPVLESAIDEARLLYNNYCDTEHLLLALAGDQGLVGRVLREQKISQEPARQMVRAIQQGDFQFSHSP